MYYADLDQDVIWAYDLDTATGAISNKRVFVGPGSAPGIPDGSTVDAEGYRLERALERLVRRPLRARRHAGPHH